VDDDITNDLYAGEDEATLARVFGEKGDYIEVFIKPPSREAAANKDFGCGSSQSPGKRGNRKSGC
jgi:hypothetical protein